MWPLIVLTDESRYTLPVALANLVGEHVPDTELMMAGAVVTVLPVLVLFLLLQRQYVEGITLGGRQGVRRLPRACRAALALLAARAGAPPTRRRSTPSTGIAGLDRRAVRRRRADARRRTRGESGGGALRMDFDFGGHAGWAAARKAFPRRAAGELGVPLRLRGEAPAADARVQAARPDRARTSGGRCAATSTFPGDWTTLRIRKRAGRVRVGTRAAAASSRSSASSRSR